MEVGVADAGVEMTADVGTETLLDIDDVIVGFDNITLVAIVVMTTDDDRVGMGVREIDTGALTLILALTFTEALILADTLTLIDTEVLTLIDGVTLAGGLIDTLVAGGMEVDTVFGLEDGSILVLVSHTVEQTLVRS